MINITRKGLPIFIIILLFGAYFIYQSRNIFSKPKIFVENLKEYNVVKKATLPIKGNIKNAVDINLNGRKIFVDEKGFFDEELILALGYNIIQIKVKDRFGEEIAKDYIVILK